MPNKDLTFRLFGEDISASKTVGSLAEATEGLTRKVSPGFASMRGIATGVGLAAGAAAIGIAGAALSGAAAAEQSQAKVAASLGLTEKESARVGTVAGKVFADNYGESIDQVQDTVGGIVTGISGMEKASNGAVSGMTTKVLSFSQAFETDASDSIQQVSQLIESGFAKDGPAAIDLLTASMQKVPKAVRGDLIDAANEYAPFMSQLGLSGAAGMQLLVDASGKGMYGLDKTGDALKEFTIRSTDMSKTSVSAYEALGLNADTMAGKILKGGKTARGGLDQIIDRLLGMDDPVARSNTAIALFGTQMEDIGVGDVPKFLKGLRDVGGGMDDTKGAAGRLTDTIGGGAANSVDAFSRKWDAVTQSLVSGLLPIATEVFSFLANNEGLLKGLAIGLGIVALAIGGVTIAMWAMSLTPVALWVGAIVAGVALLIVGIVALIQNWDTVCAWLQDVWGAVCKWFGDTLDSIGTWWSDTWNGLLTAGRQLWGRITDFIGGIPQKILDFFLNWTLLGIIIGHWDQIVAGTKSAWGAVTEFIGGIPKKVLDFFVGIGQWLFDAGSTLLKGLLGGAKDGLVGLATWVAGINAKVVGWLADAGQWLLDTGSDLLKGLLGGAKDGFQVVVDWAAGIGGRVIRAIGAANELLLQVGKDVVAGLVQGIRDMIGDVTSTISDLVGGAVKAAKRLLGIHSPSRVFKEIGKFLGEGFRDGIDGSKSDVLGAMRDLVDKVVELPEKAFKKKGLTESAVVASLRAEQKALGILAGERDGIAKRLEGAQERLENALSTRNDYRSTVSGGVTGLGSVANAEAQKDEEGNPVALAASDLIAQKRTILDATSTFAGQIEQLKKLGLNDDDYKAIVDQFQSTGDTSLAGALLAGGQAAVDEVNGLNGRLRDTADRLGSDTSARLYQAGVDSARAYKDSLEAQSTVITGAMGVVELRVAQSLTTLGINTKPLATMAGNDIEDGVAVGLKEKRSVFSAMEDVSKDAAEAVAALGVKTKPHGKKAGKDVVDGIIEGLRGGKDRLDRVSASLGRGMVRSIKKELKIKSPSGVFRDEVGAMIPAGVADGVKANTGELDRSLTAMVNVPAPRYATAPGTVGLPGQIPGAAGTGGQRPLVQIDNFHATPAQSPADIAAELGWLTRGGL